jgi:hypothetical protein
MQDAGYVRLISWTLQSGSEQVQCSVIIIFGVIPNIVRKLLVLTWF